MLNSRITNFLLCLFLGLALSSCSISSSENPISFSPADPSLLQSAVSQPASSSQKNYAEFIDSTQPLEFYEKAYAKSQPVRPIKSQVFGGLLPTNQNLAPEIASYFDHLSKQEQDPELVILALPNLGPKANHTKITTSLAYKTPYGFLDPAPELTQQLQNNWLAFNNPASFKSNPQVGFYAPFIKNSFPNSRFLPILLDQTLTDQEAATLGQKIAELTPKNTLLLSATNLSNHGQYDLARFQTRYTRSLLASATSQPLADLSIQSTANVHLLQSFLSDRKAQKTIYHSKGISEQGGYLFQSYLAGEPKPKPEATLIAVGDVMIDRYVRTLSERHGSDYAFQKIAPQKLLKSAHLIHANLEGPVTDVRSRRGSVIFKFDPEQLPELIKQGINLVSISNNHTLDQRPEGFENTKRYLDEAGLDWFGHPLNQSDGHTLIKEINGLKIGFIGFHDATIRLDKESAIADIQSMRPFVDRLVVSVHWGPEYKLKSHPRQQDLGRSFVDAGADAVIGHHPHVVQEVEWYQGRPIIYSLGNFIFDQYWSQNTQKGLAIGLIFSPSEIELYEFPIELPSSQPRLSGLSD